MASVRKAMKRDPVRDAAVDYFAARSHNAWRKRLLETNPEQKGKPRMRLRGGVMVDVNQPWAKLHPKAKADNERAARDAYDAVRRFPNDREAAAEYVHQCWIKRNKSDPSQPKELFKPYARLSKVEKDKDRAHVDNMKRALAAVGAKARKKAPIRKTKPTPTATINLDPRAARRIEAAAKELSKALGREVPPELLLSAAVDVIAAISKTIVAQSRTKR